MHKVRRNIYEKDKIRGYLKQTEANCLGIIYNSLIHSVPKAKTMRLLTNEIEIAAKKCGFSYLESHQLWLVVYETYEKCSKKSFSGLRKVNKDLKTTNYEQYISKRTEIVYDVLGKWAFSDRVIGKQLTKIQNELENEYKRDKIYWMIEDRKTSYAYTPFYLCSAHTNPAHDHKDWEGKVYYDEDWEKYVADQDTKESIRAYIKNKKLDTIQWVIGPPVYMTTRPNCRHYFRAVPIKECLTHSNKSMLGNRNMYMSDETTRSRAELTLRVYKERLEMHQLMWKTMPNPKLAKDISEDKRLIAKWAAVLDSENKKTR